MPSFNLCAVASALCGAAVVSAHGHVTNVTTPDGTVHPGFEPNNRSNPSNVAGWQTDVKDNGFVGKDTYSTPDIICHLGAQNAAASIEVAAGDVLTMTWDKWPSSHHGPVMDYLASCGSSGCSLVDKTSLEFFKISEVGNIVPGTGDDGLWAADVLLQNNLQWQVQIPDFIAPGEYVLRHELLALHAVDAPQNYPQCINLVVTGGGSEIPEGVPGTALYADYEDFNIYRPFDSYPIPGPPMIAGATPIIDQFSSDAEGGQGEAPAATTTTATEEAPAAMTTTATEEAPAAMTTTATEEAPAATTTTATEEAPASTGSPTVQACTAIERPRKSRGKSRHRGQRNRRPHARSLA